MSMYDEEEFMGYEREEVIVESTTRLYMASVITGIVEVVSMKGNSFKINGAWYSAYKADALKGAVAGDEVRFDWKLSKTGEFNNIVGNVTVLGASPGLRGVDTAVTAREVWSPVAKPYIPPARKMDYGTFPIDPRDGVRSLIRQNALGHACGLTIGKGLGGATAGDPATLVAYTISIAKEFEAYIAGDSDTATVAKVLADVKAD